MLARNILTGATALVTSVVVSVTEVLANPQTGQPAEWQLGFQRAVTPVMESINTLHNYVLILITLISLFILALLIFVAVRFNAKSNPNPSQVTHNTVIEVLWTVVPILILVVMAIPSFKLLYLQDTFPEHVDLNIKATAYQWFWTYEYPDEGFEFDAFKLEAEEAEEVGEPYLLAVDTKVVVPVGKVVRVQVTSADVIHAWAVPALGVKMDAYPGRLNELWFQVNEPGVYYGQCSELCGQGHAFMPIAVEAMLEAEYEVWLNEAREEYARIGENIRVADSNLSVAK
ncbi:MAG TPA: cytochrome c oxidase subunit II [Alphaproteobacteria bacterium]|jgi:cytochrome c oxidase subunit 2|nr:MAG: cytochrome c oxidase subunit 2 [Alphaproteobacteria bacterium MarineAlpha9_Bin6]PPR40106.1 MAG: cytochrome c oxidase subunit 2 [Alphaproteobacteria bacterium MarineAlpha9_Bin5]HIC73053.1 cytochrome c oxidase subunit II [Alphaproteobacteria bacterium]